MVETVTKTSPDTRPSAPAASEGRRGNGDKRRVLLDGALAVFSADGYSRASIDNIARTAGVSSRTIYNHFTDKATLFEAVIVDSAERVAEAQIITVQRYLGKIVDIETDLLEFGRIWSTPTPEYMPHFALVGQITADADHIPRAALEAWQHAGPLRVRAEIATCLRRIADAGQLAIDDAEIAAAHLTWLIIGARTFHGPILEPAEEIHRLADAGVRAFLRGYLPAGGVATKRTAGRR
jgi:AcrR family transcriptional regulator